MLRYHTTMNSFCQEIFAKKSFFFCKKSFDRQIFPVFLIF